MDNSEGPPHSDLQEGMTGKRRVLLNAVVAALQTLVSGIVLFFLYRYLLNTIGEEDLGVWALVLATTSAAGLANLGIATSTVKFVAETMAKDDLAATNSIIQTSAVSVALILAIVLPLLFPVLQFLLKELIEPAVKIPSGLLILPYALLSFWLNAVAGVFQSSIDGFHRVDLRGYILIGSILIYLALVYWLVPINGLEGLAQAQVIQACLLLVASWIVLKRLMPTLPIIPFRWKRSTFKMILGYSLNFQVISIAQLLMEPITKGLMSRFAGVGVLAYFEMAQRMVFQLRALIATAHQAIVPTISALHASAPGKLSEIYRQSFRLIIFFILIALPAFIAATPFISYLWIGSYNGWFIFFANLIFTGWFLNLLANPAYFANLGTGDLKWNVIGHLIMGGLNLILGLLLGYFLGAAGIAIGFTIAILAGSGTIVFAYHVRHRMKIIDLIDKASIYLGITAFAGLYTASLLFKYAQMNLQPIKLGMLSLLIFACFIALPLWRHPMRPRILSWVVTLFSNSTPPASI